jgi:hypothetical protein
MQKAAKQYLHQNVFRPSLITFFFTLGDALKLKNCFKIQVKRASLKMVTNKVFIVPVISEEELRLHEASSSARDKSMES